MKRTILFTLLLAIASAACGQTYSLDLSTPPTAKPCAYDTVRFHAHHSSGIKSISVYTSPLLGLSSYNLVYEFKSISGKMLTDSSFAVPVSTGVDQLYYQVTMNEGEPDVTVRQGMFLLTVPHVASHNSRYANTVKLTDYLLHCKPIAKGSRVVTYFEGSCSQLLSCGDTSIAQRDGELVVTIYGDDPATPEVDGVADGDNAVLYLATGNSLEPLSIPHRYSQRLPAADTVFVRSYSATGYNYLPQLAPYGKVSWGAVNAPVSKTFTVSNMQCNKMLQPKITGFDIDPASRVHYTATKLNDTSFAVTYDGKGYGDASVGVLFSDPAPYPAGNVHHETIFFEGCGGDHTVSVTVEDELGKSMCILTGKMKGFANVDTLNKWGTCSGMFRTGVPRGWSGTISLDTAGYLLSPPAAAIANLQKDTLIRFIALYQGTRQIKLGVHRGPILVDPSQNYAVVTPVLANADINIGGTIVSAGAAGIYLGQLPARWSGKIVPIYPGYAFDTLVVASLLKDTEHHFGSVYVGNYTVSGTCLSRDGHPIAGAAVYTATDTAYTDANGKYSFQIRAGWSGTFNVSKADYFFDMYPGGIALNTLSRDTVLPLIQGIERYIRLSNPAIMQRLQKDTKINTDGDGYVQLREARAYTGMLNVSGMLTGNDMLELYAFANITDLNISNCPLDAIDFGRFPDLESIIAQKCSLKEMILTDNPFMQLVYTLNSPDLTLICGASSLLTVKVDAHTVVSADCTVPDKQDIVLEQGWNIISLNVSPDVCAGGKPCIAALFSGLDVAEIKSQDAFWRIGQPAMFNTLTSLEPGKGYLVYMNNAGTLTISGTKAGISSVGTLRPGWNLVGSPYTYPVPFFDILGNRIREIKDFDDFTIIGTGGSTLVDMMPGKAYFVKK